MIGGGPAGSAAALAALLEGGAADVVERSKFPRHKVCGEFLSPEIAPVLERLGVWNAFLLQNPARIQRMELHFGAKPVVAKLPEPAYGLSRFAYDQLLHSSAIERGARSLLEASAEGGTRILTTGRRAEAKGNRIFGFKAHYTGPVHDAVELYFFRGCYVGVNCVENGVTNVCGLGPEKLLNEVQFDIDDLVQTSPALRARLQPLSRSMKWMHVGPLVFQNQLNGTPEPGVYLAGDALSFVDPFTGSGLLAAAITGELAGSYAARGISSAEHRNACRKALAKPFGMSSLLRKVARTRWAEYLAPFVHGEWLYRLTRPRTTT